MFFVMDRDTNETIAMTRFEHAANEIAKAFGVENCIVRFGECSNTTQPIFNNSKA